MEQEGTRVAEVLENGIVEIGAEPDFAKRRDLMRCPALRRARVLERGEGATGAKESELWLMQQVRSQLIGGALGEILGLCNVNVKFPDGESTQFC